MTGTSCDGLDACCLSIDSNGFEARWSSSTPYPASLRQRVLKAQAPGARVSIREFLELDRDLGDFYGRTLRAMITRKKGGPVHVIANHGQTVAHFPQDGTTLQMGNAARIAHATGLTVVSAFRDGDLAAGGEGAPLAPLFHQIIAQGAQPERGTPGGAVSIHNMGGISNLTYVPRRGQIIAFDTGPGNIWIDEATRIATRGARTFDRSGSLASKGEPDIRAVEKILRLAYFKRRPPKSTGRDDFPFEVLRKATRAAGADLVATATAITVESVARAYEGLPHGLSAIYVCGGGAKNDFVLRSLSARLGIRVSPIQQLGLDPQYIEAQAFALFGFLSLNGQPLGGSWTGARGFGPPGHITPGKNWNQVTEVLAQLG